MRVTNKIIIKKNILKFQTFTCGLTFSIEKKERKKKQFQTTESEVLLQMELEVINKQKKNK